MKREIASREELMSAFRYNPKTGFFYRKSDGDGKGKLGKIVGCKSGAGYIRIFYNGRYYLAHRLAWLFHYGVWPVQTDHINRIKQDNRIKNLRECDTKTNMRNKGAQKRNTSGVNGVCFDEKRGKWLSHIRGDGKTLILGRFPDVLSAAQARYDAEVKYKYTECIENPTSLRFIKASVNGR